MTNFMTNASKILAPALLGATLLPLAAHAQAPYGQDGRPDFRGVRPNSPGGYPNYQGGSRDILGNPSEFRGAQTVGGLRWEGDVDDTTLVTIRHRDVQTRTVFGKGASDVHARLFGFAPERPAVVFLRHAEGRGRVRVVQQPSPENDWTAVVRLHDPQPGRAHYAFDLVWPGGDGDDRGQGRGEYREDGRDFGRDGRG